MMPLQCWLPFRSARPQGNPRLWSLAWGVFEECTPIRLVDKHKQAHPRPSLEMSALGAGWPSPCENLVGS